MPILGSFGAGAARGFGETSGAAKGLINATGGTITCDGDYRIHTFTGPGTFCVACICACVPAGNRKIDYLILGGGGAGGTSGRSGGGGAGGFRESHEVPISGSYTASPVAVSNAQTIAAGGYPISVGSGGSQSNPPGRAPNTTGFGISSSGGGQGAQEWGSSPGSPGGSGGGGGQESGSAGNGAGSGNSGGYSPPEGNGGANGTKTPALPWGGAGGGGGGAAQSGFDGPNGNEAGKGGDGHGTQISPADGTPGPSGPLRYFSGGGGGKAQACCTPSANRRGDGGAGGGGGQPGSQSCGFSPVCVAVPVGPAGTAGGAAFGTGAAGAVIIRYKFA